MSQRFRVRFRGGGQATVESLEAFCDLVQSGRISADDLVHDALTGEWVPASAHPVYKLALDPLVTSEQDGAAADDSDPPLGESTAADFLRQVEAERPPKPQWAPDDVSMGDATDLSVEDVFHRGASIVDSGTEDTIDMGSGIVGGRVADSRDMDVVDIGDLRPEPTFDLESGVLDTGERKALERDSGVDMGPGVDMGSGIDMGSDVDMGSGVDMGPGVDMGSGIDMGSSIDMGFGPTFDMGVGPGARSQGYEDDYRAPPSRVPRARPGAGPARPRRRRRILRLGLTLILIFGAVGVAGSVGLVWPDLGGFGAGGASAEPGEVAGTATEAQLSAAAYEAFLGEVASLAGGMRVGPVPRDWLQGRYLADAEAYPGVGHYWTRYRNYVEEAEDRETELYREAYLGALERRGVRGAQRTLRLAGGMVAFRRGRSARADAYDRALELAEAALALHDLAVAATGRITYEPARANQLSADPVMEATASDERTQARLDRALDRVLDAMRAAPPRNRLQGWLVEMLRTPATSR